VLHGHLFHANVLARAVRPLCAVPVVVSTIHSLAESGRDSDDVSRRDQIYRFTDPLCDMTTCVCGAAARRHIDAHAVSPSKVQVVPNGVDIARFRTDGGARKRMRRELGLGNEFVWLAAGRLMWKKDYGTMLEAMARLRTGTLLIAGAGVLEEHLRNQALELGAPVRLLGERNDVAALMNAADAVLLSSVVEGLPMVLLEAAAAGLPAVATDTGGVSDIIRDGETGYVVPPREPVRFAEAMERLAGMPSAKRTAMGRAARDRAVAEFDVRRTAATYERLYRELLAASARRAHEWM
jgi:glycosyltransferase involved in cell wall biosynthesis